MLHQVHDATRNYLGLLNRMMLMYYVSLGITEAFKADSFDKKINLGTYHSTCDPYLELHRETDEALTVYTQVLAPTAMTRESLTSCPLSSRLRTRSSPRA